MHDDTIQIPSNIPLQHFTKIMSR